MDPTLVMRHPTDPGNYSFGVTMPNGTDLQQVRRYRSRRRSTVNQWTRNPQRKHGVLVLPATTQADLKDQAVDQALKIIESRINAFGVKEPTLQRHVEIDPARSFCRCRVVENPERVKKLIGADSNLALMKIVGAANPRLYRPTRLKRQRNSRSAASSSPIPKGPAVHRTRRRFEDRADPAGLKSHSNSS